jgi:hypothetical protein
MKIFNLTNYKYQIIDGDTMHAVTIYSEISIKFWK